MPDDDLTAALEEIQELVSKRDEALAWAARASADDGELDAAAGAFEAAQDKLAARASRLLAALRAVLELHQPVDRGTGPQCKGCATHITHTPWPCRTCQAISREITRKGENDA